MRKILFLLMLLAVASPLLADGGHCPDVSWHEPVDSADFGSAIPIGNGHIGAKLFGMPCRDVINVNEATLWSGVPRDYNNPANRERIAAIRRALYDEDYVAAQRLSENLSEHDNEAYMPLGDIVLRMIHDSAYSDYAHTLSMEQAVVTLSYSVDGVRYTRESFASHADNVIVMRITADRRHSVSLVAGLRSVLHNECSAAGTTVRMSGRAPSHVDTYRKDKIVEWTDGGGMGFDAIMSLRQKGGTIAQKGDSLMVTGADEVCLVFTASTQYAGASVDPRTGGKDCRAMAKATMAKAAAMDYRQLKARHLADYQPLFSRVRLQINGQPDNRYAMAYQWARYCLLACSREDSEAPRNEQGIWNRDMLPRYASNYTLNENPEKYYALAETANIGECVSPLIRFVGALAANGAVTARTEYGFRGWVAHHNSDVWAKTTMATGRPCWSVWPMGGVWLTQHVWERYSYGMDKKYLSETAYPLMKGAAEFCLDLLMRNSDGYLVTAPSTSPENSFLGPVGERLSVDAGTTADMALVRELFDHCIAACKILGIDQAFRDTLVSVSSELRPYRIGERGELLEYSKEFGEFEPYHHHASHCIALWPLNQISRDRNPQLLDAVRRTLELRGSGGYHPDKAAMMARLGDGDACLKVLNPSFPKLYDTPFGGFGEMMVQSHGAYIDVLPALPASWLSGSVHGLCARGGYVLDIDWADGELTSLKIHAPGGIAPKYIRVKGELTEVSKDSRISVIEK